MKFDKTKIHCPKCLREYDCDASVYKNRARLECVCGRKWNVDQELEKICREKVKPYRIWNEKLTYLILIILPGLVALIVWREYSPRAKKMRANYDRLKKMIEIKTDHPDLKSNLEMMLRNIRESERRGEMGLYSFLIGIVASAFLGVIFR